MLAVYPFSLFVTFLHELGHALASILTGGGVEGFNVHSDGSGYAVTTGGVRWIIVMGGYIGSVILGNLLLYIGVTNERIAKPVLYVIIGALIFVSLFWFTHFTSSLILIAMSAVLVFFAQKRRTTAATVLTILGIISVLYVIEDFNVGPSSDLVQFEKYIPIFGATIWMYIWLALAVFITYFNVKQVIKKTRAV